MDTDFDTIAETQPARRTLGERLKAERLARGLDLAGISARTRIPQRMLVAIEADAHDALPNATFATGFVKSFARELGLDTGEAAAQFRAENSKQPHISVAQPLEPLEPDRVPSRRLALISAAVVVAAIVAAVALTRGGGDAVDPGTARVEQPVPAASVAIAPPASVAAASGAVVLTSSEDAWIEISDRASGTPVMSGILAAGQSYTVPPGDLALRTGRAGALRVTVGGRVLPPLGGPVDRIRDVSLDAAALVQRAAAPPPPALP